MKNEKLYNISKESNIDWKKKVSFLKENEKWLGFSSQIARRVLAAMEEKDGLTQRALAEKIGVSPQNINKILKGDANLTLKTIANLSTALEVELLTFPIYKDDYIVTTIAYLPPVSGNLNLFNIVSDINRGFSAQSKYQLKAKFTKSNQYANEASA